MKQPKKTLSGTKRTKRYPHVVTLRICDATYEWLNIQAYKLNMYPGEVARNILTDAIRSRRSNNYRSTQISQKIWKWGK